MTLENTATWKEIHAQPRIWREWAEEFAPRIDDIRAWWRAHDPSSVVFSGAGTSAYIGDILCAEAGHQYFSYPSTSIVADPKSFFLKHDHPLVVQFGRSGNSSESIGVLDVLDASGSLSPRLNITCNRESALATRQAKTKAESLAVILPEDTHDEGFAMTSSFSTMLLTAMAIFYEDFSAEDWQSAVLKLADQAEALLKARSAQSDAIPERAIYLGSGALGMAAREMALKTLELTAGDVMTASESTLGFRHGPKAAVTSKTSIYLMNHGDPYTRQYDRDLAVELRKQFPQSRITTQGPEGDIAFGSLGISALDAILHVMITQIQSAQWSHELGLNVDDPFIDHGNLSRVVSGVTLYPYEAHHEQNSRRRD